MTIKKNAIDSRFFRGYSRSFDIFAVINVKTKRFLTDIVSESFSAYFRMLIIFEEIMALSTFF